MLRVLAKATDNSGLYEKVKQKALELEEVEIIRSMSRQRSDFSLNDLVQDSNTTLQQPIYSSNQVDYRCTSNVMYGEDGVAFDANALSNRGLCAISAAGNPGILGLGEPISGVPFLSRGRELRRRENNSLQVMNFSESGSATGKFSNFWHKRHKLHVRCYGCHGLGHKYHACPSKKMKRVVTQVESAPIGAPCQAGEYDQWTTSDLVCRHEDVSSWRGGM
jgi:hypothetical protein